MSTLETETSACSAGDEPRDLSWLDHPTCEELAWLDTLRRRVVARTKPDVETAVAELAVGHALLDGRVLKHR